MIKRNPFGRDYLAIKISEITTVPLKWTNRSLKSLK